MGSGSKSGTSPIKYFVMFIGGCHLLRFLIQALENVLLSSGCTGRGERRGDDLTYET